MQWRHMPPNSITSQRFWACGRERLASARVAGRRTWGGRWGSAHTSSASDPGHFRAEWGKRSELVFEPKYADGRTRVLIRRTESHYLLWFDVYGRFIVSLDGAEVGCEAAGARAPQERILFAQLLPLAAVLSGFEVLHGSAVVAGDGVAVFIGPSGMERRRWRAGWCCAAPDS